MKQYKSHKIVSAELIASVGRVFNVFEITLADGSQFHEEGGQFEKAEAGGYFVIYDGGYHSYSPAAAFEEGYSAIDAPSRKNAAGSISDSSMHGTFGYALALLKAGRKVARAGWNGASQWVAMGKGQHIAPEEFWNEHTRAFAQARAATAMASTASPTSR